MYFYDKLGLVFLITIYSLTSIAAQDVCVKKAPCICVFPNGTGIDLTSISKKDFFSAPIYAEKKSGEQLELSTYFYHPCYDEPLPEAINVVGNNNTCNKNLTICRHVYTLDYDNTTTSFKKDLGVYNYMGNSNDSTFSANGDAIIYENPPSKTIVLLICAQTDDSFHVKSVAEPNQIELILYSRAACLMKLNLPDESGRSLGSTLLIIFFSLTIFYLVLGICTKKFLMGATGVEVIPNLAFWSDLPNLVKDGWAFTVAGFKLPVRGSGPALSPDPNSYDSI